MPFTTHLFISYTHDDNMPLAGEEEGWVSLLHEDLDTLLPIRLGQKPVIWRDNKLNGNDSFSDEIFAQLAEVALVLCVLSRKYVSSEWCRKEAQAFWEIASKAGIKVGNKTRIFKVIKLPVGNQPEGLPEEFGRLTGYPFYITKDNHDLELDPAFGLEMRAEFHLRSAMLAQDLADTLLALNQVSEAASAGPPKKGTIFLGATSWDRDCDRKKLEVELTGRGYAVLPNRELPVGEEPCVAEIKKLLPGCDLSIHILGNFPAIVPSGPTQKSLDILQNELAVEESKTRGIPRLIWVPDENQSQVPSHQEFLKLLERDDNAQHGADVVRGGIEVFKGAVLQSLQKLEQKKSGPPPKASAGEVDPGRLIYVICDKRDRQATVELREALTSRGFEPRRPLFEGDAATVRQQNDAMLAQCGLVVIYYGAGDKDWYQNTLAEVQKSKSGARVWTYLAAPLTANKELLLDKDEGNRIINAIASQLPQAELDRMLTDPLNSAAAGGQ